MATITTEFGKLSSKKQRAVYLLVRDKKTVKRIITGVKVDESEISPKTKKIKNFEKAQIVEKLKSELAANLSSMAPEINYSDNMDATKIASKIVKKKKVDTLDFFSFAELWDYGIGIEFVKEHQREEKSTLVSKKTPRLLNSLDRSFLGYAD